MFDDCSNLKKPENKGKLNKLTTSIMKTSTLEVACRSGLSTCDAFNKIREKKKKEENLNNDYCACVCGSKQSLVDVIIMMMMITHIVNNNHQPTIGYPQS